MNSFASKTRTLEEEKAGIDALLSYISVNVETGLCLWKDKQKFSNVIIGHEAGCLTAKGYRSIEFNGNAYKTHRIVFYVANGYLPQIVDHIKGISFGNGICNLQEATNQQNTMKKKMHSNNKSGFRGVSWDKERNKWLAQIQINGKFKKLGRFATPEEANQAYIEKAKVVFGEFYES